ncbi:tRNA(Ser) Um(44) 2'-O-methyltransferase [Blastocladiella emersonii ATCC 22665]|nr:tRNA(Ser) Um(44) 2'-O-methyltransferase [Blastocladiella emersonii ATCC 22665]
MGKRQKKDRVDPYFQLYAPVATYEPAAADGAEPVLVGYTQEVVFARSIFDGCLERWVTSPDTIGHLYAPYRTFELVEDGSVPATTPESPAVRTVVRRLLPKGEQQRPTTERVTVVTDAARGVSSFTFEPVLDADAEGAPDRAYFQVERFSFTYEPLEGTAAAAVAGPTEESAATEPARAVAAGTVLTPIARIVFRWVPLSPSAAAAAAARGNEPTKQAVFDQLMQKCFKWCTHDLLGGYTPVAKDVLVQRSAFSELYAGLKKKYAYLVTTWTEKTDPKKFVYEDLALVAYLTSMWLAADPNARDHVVFADLGCGNGLLTYLLHKEGFRGYGVDLRARKIWPRWLAEGARLVETTLQLTEYALPCDVTWILGNHADEVCPWIPEIALRPRTAPATLELAEGAVDPREGTVVAPKLFILPCCFYNKEGQLFPPPASSFPVPQHLANAGSRYKRYLQYIGEQCDAAGFDVVYDALRIPSTKNQALVCTFRGDVASEAATTTTTTST